jgi:glycosyltransferase involved in cell wall biosynthesis
MKTNIAFCIMGGRDWTAGQIYMKNLLYVLHLIYNKEVTLNFLSLGENQYSKEYSNIINADKIIFYKTPRRLTPLWTINEIIRRLLKYNIHMEDLLKKHGINIIFGPTLCYKYMNIATISLLPDFQHSHLPEMFSKAECQSRDQTFLQSAKLSTLIILLSEAAKKDFESFAPMYAHKVRVLHPINYIPTSIYEYNLKSILKLYHLPEKFVFLPNQFWKHKNHELVFMALKILKEKGIKVILICSGNHHDYRHKLYFSDLWKNISEWDIRDQVIYLGLIPYDHVLYLIRQSVCVLNPSRFEGWGMTTDEAQSIGKQVLLSNIPVFNEQKIPKAIFFDPYNYKDLAVKLSTIWRGTKPGPDNKLECEARKNHLIRIHTYATSFMSIIHEAIQLNNAI